MRSKIERIVLFGLVLAITHATQSFSWAAKKTAPKGSDKTLPKSPEPECKTLEDFSASGENSFPAHWRARDEDDQPAASSERRYVVEKEGATRFLHAIYKGRAITIVRQVEDWDLKLYPYLEWQWRVSALPQGADESKLGSNDSAASVYVVWKERWPMQGSFLRFAWSSSLPVNTLISRRFNYEKILILESGAQKLGTWQKARVNVAELSAKELKKKFQKPLVLAILTDADSTKTSAEASFANFRICKN